MRSEMRIRLYVKARARRTRPRQKTVWPMSPSGRWAATSVRSSRRARGGSTWLKATAWRQESQKNWSGYLTGSGQV
jgi:hypothetical protein